VRARTSPRSEAENASRVRYIVPHRLSHGKRSAGCVEAEEVGAELHAGHGLREGFELGLMTDEAVSSGIRATVTSAAAVMIGVFSVVATLSSLTSGRWASGWRPPCSST
jgi:hypothetical protein